MRIVNPKAAAWDLLGAQFWEKGRPSARPSAAELDLFLTGLPPGEAVAVVGASTKDLVHLAVARGLRVTVMDFSQRMCSDLRAALPDDAFALELRDITAAVPIHQREQFSVVLSDRLINRFTHAEAQRALRAMRDLTKTGGEVRTSVKLGNYAMDERMIDEGRRRCVLADFFDAHTRTIDFSRAGEVLENALLPHGEIPHKTLLAWYRGRGLESRYGEADVVRAALEAGESGGRLELARVAPFPDAPSTVGFVFTAA